MIYFLHLEISDGDMKIKQTRLSIMEATFLSY